jgi:hypothetical protein
MKNILFIIYLLFLLSLSSCKDESIPPQPDSVLNLKLEDVSCTEAWVELTTTSLQLPASLNLLKDDNLIKIINLQTADTLLYLDSLLPNKTYNFQLTSILNPVSSNELSITTMDTTSHNFTWQTFELGIIENQSHLFDVAIINENDIWAVGEIMIADTSVIGYTMYNAIHWNGIEWTLHRIMFKTICGQQSSQNAYPASSILAFSESEIWVAQKGDQIAKIENGVQINSICMPWTFSINKIWGTSNNDLYVVGNNGNIAHYNGSQWSKIETGTNLSFIDIAVNSSNEIFICGGNSSFGQGIILKSTDGNNFTVFAEGANIYESQLFNPKLYGSFSSIWFDQNNTLYSGGNILFQNKFNTWSYVKSLPENFIGGNPGVYYRGYITKVRGNASNDMWIVGDRNTVRHFNGLSWQQIGMPYDPNIDIVWRGMACKDNNTIIVGTHNRSAIIMMIKK